MEILLVAPSRDLRYANQEIQQIINLLHPDILLDDGATISGFLDALEKEYGIIWFAGHSGLDGLKMNDGILGADTLSQFLLNSSASLFINSCSSLLVALQMNRELRINVIATISDVEDVKAYQTGVLFARMLAKGLSIRQAFEESNTSMSQYVFLPGIDNNTEVIDMLRGEIDVMRFLVENIERQRDETWENYKEYADNTYHPRLDAQSIRRWTIGFIVFTANMILYYSDVRELLNISWIAAVIFGLIALPVSGYFFITGLKMSREKKEDSE